MHLRRYLSGSVVAILSSLSGMAAFGPAQALERVQFTVSGAPAELAANLRSASGLVALPADRDSGEDILATARAEYGALIGTLYAQGYYGPVISVQLDGREASNIAPLDRPARVGRITVQVSPGPQFAFGKIDISPRTRGTQWPEEFRPGNVAGAGTLRSAVAAAVDGWREAGHAKARVLDQDVVADHPNRRLNAAVRIEAGPKLRFGDVAVAGNLRTRENRVRKIAGIPQGEVYSPSEVQRAENRLRRTGAFTSVSIAEDAGITPPDLLGTTINVVEEKPRHFSFGAEISSLEGVTLSGAWMHRNLLGGAEKLRVEGEIGNIGAADSGVDYRLGVTLDRPATFTPDTTLRFSTEIARVDEADYRANSFDLGVGLTHIVNDQLSGRVDLVYSYINGTAYSEDGQTASDFIYRSLSLPIGVTWDKRNSKTDATKGFYIETEVKPFQGLSDTGSGVRVTGDLRGYYGFGRRDKVVLAARAQLGMVAGASLQEVPRDDLFYSGGGGTVRGQPYQSLGVRFTEGGTDYKVGGDYFLAASAEARVKVTSKIGLVGFVDAGRVDNGGFFENGDWHSGAGLGLRYATGVGPARLDLAAPVGGNTGSGMQIYVGLGHAF